MLSKFYNKNLGNPQEQEEKVTLIKDLREEKKK